MTKLSARGKKKGAQKRDPFDYYPTPAWCVDRFLEADVLPRTPGVWLEPSAGDGAVLRAVDAFRAVEDSTVVKYEPRWVAYEIQPRFEESLLASSTSPQVEIDNFLDLGSRIHLGFTPSVIIGNPPYSFAMDFVKKSIELKAAFICFLLRISFLGSAERSSFMRANMPDVYMLPNRPSFRAGGSDTSEYGWFVWRRAEDGSYAKTEGKISILKSTSKEQRATVKTTI